MPMCVVNSLGILRYSQAWGLQKLLAKQRANAGVLDSLLLVEHPHVYTLGQRSEDSEVLLSPQELQEVGAEVFHVDRGGLATYHGPGQLVGYPILDLHALGYGPVRYVRTLEQVIVETARRLGVVATCREGLTGVWVGERKLAAIGVRVSRGVSSHGFALNVNTDLSYFEHVIPCGMPDTHATSLAQELGKPVDMQHVQAVLVEEFGKAFGFTMQHADAAALAGTAPPTRMSDARGLRIIITATTGSGKTTLAKELSARLGIPRIELDELHWAPNWREKQNDVFRQLTADAIAGKDAWVADGNYSPVRDVLWPKAQTLVWLDYRFSVVFWRLARRTILRSVRREVLWHGNQERMAKHFFPRESIFWWLLKTYWRRKRETPLLLARPEYAHLTVVHLKSPGATRQWVEEFAPAEVIAKKP